MKVTPVFIVASLVCAAPFALAVRDDLKGGRHKAHAAFDDIDGDEDLDEYAAARRLRYQEEMEQYERMMKEREAAANFKVDDLPSLLGAGPATMGPVLAGLRLGAPSESFQSDETRERIAAFKGDHPVEVDFDFDTVALNAVTLRLTGSESELRDGVISLWGAPRLLGEDELVWLGDGVRAVYTASYDGLELKFEPAMTAAQLIAPTDKAKLGFEPSPLIGSAAAKVVDLLPGLEDGGVGEWQLSLPGVGHGSGRTAVSISADDRGAKIRRIYLEGSTLDTEELRTAAIAKWGAPEESDAGMSWTKGGVSIVLVIDDRFFSLTESR